MSPARTASASHAGGVPLSCPDTVRTTAEVVFPAAPDTPIPPSRTEANSIQPCPSPGKCCLNGRLQTMYFELGILSCQTVLFGFSGTSHSTTPHIRRFETVSPVFAHISHTTLAEMDSPASTCPPGNVSPHHGVVGFAKRCWTRMRPVAVPSIMHMLQRGMFIGRLQSLWILGMCRRLFLQPLPLGCANTRSYPIRPFQ